MEIKSFDTILTQMCDDFDLIISPKVMARSNTNVVYLIFKAIAKGFELINNICVVLSNKFDPAKCSEEDLVSVASLVGTERRKGSASGLRITVTNTDELSKTLLAGVYTYQLNDDTSFEFEVLSDTEIATSSSVSYIAMSNSIGRYPVTTQQSIKVDSHWNIPSSLVFSCQDNTSLLGTSEETTLAFRNRVLNTYDRQNTMVELEEYIRNLPYIFDCKVRYNQTTADIVDGGVTIPPMSCAIFYSGEAKNEIAEMVADYIVCPTVATQDSVEVRYENPVFAGGYYAVNIIPFEKLQYTIDIIYNIDGEYVSAYEAKTALEAGLKNILNTEQHVDYIKEDDIYNAIEEVGYTGIEVLAVNLKVNGSAVDYIEVPVSKIAELTSVHYAE